jgi:5'-deoxynucleotidase YfbR-like HD superfamily hydrolase
VDRVDKIRYVLRGGETKRFHTVMTLTENTVGQHSHNVAWLTHFLSGHLSVEERHLLLLTALGHDHPEQKYGDVPAPAKRNMDRDAWNEMEGALQTAAGLNYEKVITSESRRILKLADALDGAFFCCRERAMGNKLIEECYHNFKDYVIEKMDETKLAEREVFDMLEQEWSWANG